MTSPSPKPRRSKPVYKTWEQLTATEKAIAVGHPCMWSRNRQVRKQPVGKQRPGAA